MSAPNPAIRSIEERAERDLALLDKMTPRPLADAIRRAGDAVGQHETTYESCTIANTRNATLQQHADAPVAPPVILSIAELLGRPFPIREVLLAPWLTTQSLSMIYATRGTGKTHVALGIAYALASGGEFIGWRASQPVRVLYIDGEMPGADLQQRLAAIIASRIEEAPADYLRIMTPDAQPLGIMPNLYSLEGQEAINACMGDAQVVIVDNISCLVRGGKENEGESWEPVASWELAQRAAGRAVVFIHHAGKGGAQRGTSKREDLLDIVIKLGRPADYVPNEGARFEVYFEKARSLSGDDVEPFEAKLETLPDGTQAWATRKVIDATDMQIIEMHDLGMTMAEIASDLGVNKSTISRAVRRLRDEGKLPSDKTKPKARHNTGQGADDDRD
ncbi:AAA family ATPase [Dyella marensis]|uniref:Helix-turn-helix domain-containing protein n=1 Tax=Dyella marensis TaxID=500610 RepID=A0A1I2AA92_9GAMM|nr:MULTISPECIES: AAA family ATPase [Dyella]SFE40498.1 Helix-turn-helix domain-containing protein [Dyella marensis]